MIRVIVADDEYKVCQLICQLIHWDALGMQLVGTASNGIEALQMIEAEKPGTPRLNSNASLYTD